MLTTTEKNSDRPSGSADAREWPGTRPISAREHEVATMLATGHGVATIAVRLHISPHTVRNHLKALFRKVGCRSQRALVGWVQGHVVRAPRDPVADPESQRADRPALTSREREVFLAAVRGGRPTEIAREMSISPNTARNHLKAIYRKLGVRSAVELMACGAPDGPAEV